MSDYQIYGSHEDGSCSYREALKQIAAHIHGANTKWWTDLNTGEPKQRNFGEMIALVHSELSEALEGHRKNLADDHLPNRPSVEVELADAMIRIFDIAAGLGYDLGGALEDKLAYNATRYDHTVEARLQPNGKAY